MIDADLYLDEMDLEHYFTREECSKCGADSCKDLIEKLSTGDRASRHLHGLARGKARALLTAAGLRDRLPRVPQISMPRPGPPGLTELNDPSDGNPVLVTGNNVFTQDVMLTVLSTTTRPFFLLSADTGGDTLDMAVILGSFTVETVVKALEDTGLNGIAESSPLLIPGRGGCLAGPIGSATGRIAEVGPVCAAELPLFYGEMW